MTMNMGLHPLLLKGHSKRVFRWMFSLEPYIGMSASMLPPSKGSRPSVSFKEYQVEHLNETIYFPGKVEWQNLELSLYDIKCNSNPIYDWMKAIYHPHPQANDAKGFYGPSLISLDERIAKKYKTTAILSLYNGCGDIMEQWVYENAYPSKIDWGSLDMQDSNITMVDISLRYDRAYIIEAVSATPRNTPPRTSGNKIESFANSRSPI